MGYDTVTLRSGRLGKISEGHPWIYRRQLSKIDPSIKPGSLVSVLASDSKFIGTGYYNPRSNMAIRLLTFKNEPIDIDFFRRRIRDALKKREPLLSYTNACRLVFSEADSVPGLIADVYDRTIVFQALTLGIENFKEMIVEALREMIKPAFIYEKSVSEFRKKEGLKNIQTWHGEAGDVVIRIFEGGAKFFVDIEHGHKTGFYLDQRKSRMAFSNISKGKSVLDLFCYTGGFAISSALYGAKDVLAIDVKDEWLEMGRKNALLNNVSNNIVFEKGDAFRSLERIIADGRRFDIIIIDPPSFLKNRNSLRSASKGYEELNSNAMKTLNDGGILTTFSCSHNMSNELFSSIIKKSALGAGKSFTILKRCRQDQDHPIVRAIPETDYLKGYILRLDTN